MDNIDKIAQIIIENKLDREKGRKILNNMDPSQIKLLYESLKRLILKHTVYVFSKDKLSSDAKKMLKKVFPNKKIDFIQDEKIGSGIIIKENDNIYDFSLSTITKGIFSELKNKL